MKKYNIIDLFAGCGGLLDGFMQTEIFNPVASVEWEKEPLNNLKNRLKEKWKIDNIEKKCLLMDIQETEKLFKGWSDLKYGNHEGLDSLVSDSGSIDIILGGPPCQAYS
ncbi:MAG: DNA cytosine methyltransferase, partial [Fusobacteriaceae bacterium]